MYALALGFNAKKRLPLEKKAANLNPSAISGDMRWLMRSVAVADTENLDIIVKDHHTKVIEIAEEYANAGIHIIRDMIKKSTLVSERELEFQSALYAQIKKMGLGKKKNEDNNDEK